MPSINYAVVVTPTSSTSRTAVVTGKTTTGFKVYIFRNDTGATINSGFAATVHASSTVTPTYTWTRDGTTLKPANSGDNVELAGGLTQFQNDGYISSERNNVQGILPAFKITGKTNGDAKGRLEFACNAEFKLYDESDNENITLRSADGSITAAGKVTFGTTKTGNQTCLAIGPDDDRTVSIERDGSAMFMGGKCILGVSGDAGYKFAGMGSGTGQTVKYNTSTGVLSYDSSSARYKDNIRDNDDVGLETVMQLLF